MLSYILFRTTMLYEKDFNCRAIAKSLIPRYVSKVIKFSITYLVCLHRGSSLKNKSLKKYQILK